MKSILLLGILFLSIASFSQAKKEQEVDPGFISEVRQLTFQGKRSGEGYFSADGKLMVFQAEREDNNPFYQIYVLDMISGETKRISPGHGQTTCAWIHPDNKRILFSSTHLDPEYKAKADAEVEKRKQPVQARYSWSYDETYDIFTSDMNGKSLKRLTKEKGYDAEASFSPDGKWIAFASNRLGYTEKLSEEDAKIFERDPSYMMEIYIMKSDGSDVRRLTNHKGYDGGPFFSADGKKITWRRFTPNGQIAEIWTMNIDGSEQKQITRLGKMSWAPYFHPSGDYIIFASNKLGYQNFELYIVDSEGKQEPVRVTYREGFDGLPVFTPDGARLSWTFRGNNGESQIYIANWNDKLARETLKIGPATPKLSQLNSTPTESDLKSWVEYFASEKLKGRKAGSPEEQIYAEVIANYFKDLGLKPYQGSYLQGFDFISDVSLGEKNSLDLNIRGKKLSLQLNKDFTPLSFSESGEFKDAPVVFAGYGIVAPASETHAAYDSYKDLDVQGKWVLVFRDIPENIPNSQRVFLNTYSRLQHKALVAREAGAVGLLVTNGPNSSSKRSLIRLRFEGANSDSSIPVVSITDAMAEQLIAPTAKNLKHWQTANDKGQVANSEIIGTFAKSSVELIPQRTKAYNIVGVLEVRGAKSSIVVGAHGDHLGTGDSGSSLASQSQAGRIHFGADDNASGMAAVLELIHGIKEKQDQKQLKLKKNLIVGIWTAEEIGLLGAHHFVKNAKTPIDAYVNLDMVGRLKDQISVQGLASADQWKPYFEAAAVRNSVRLSLGDSPYLPTDAMAFYLGKIPVASFFTGGHSEYHTPNDTPDTLNYPGLLKVTQVVQELTENLVQSNLNPVYKFVDGDGKMRSPNRSFRIFLGTIPDYSQEGVKGVKISGTSKDSPAEKAGLKAGDVIVKVGDTNIENIYDYVYVLQSMKPNQSIPLKVLRAGKANDFNVTPVLRE